MNIYWHEYWKRAVDTADTVNTPGQPPVFKYTSHSFLLGFLFNCPENLGLACQSPDADDDIASEQN
jgi:hypothetical protein